MKSILGLFSKTVTFLHFLNPSSTYQDPIHWFSSESETWVCIFSIKSPMPRRNNISFNFVIKIWPNKALWTGRDWKFLPERLKYSFSRWLPLMASSSCWTKSSQFLQSKKNVRDLGTPFTAFSKDDWPPPTPSSKVTETESKTVGLDQINTRPSIWRCKSQSENFRRLKPTRRRFSLGAAGG